MPNKNFPYDTSYTQDRELSWLKFNDRVLSEAIDPKVPVYEKLKFISIFTSNLDEFFMIRVGSLIDLTLLKESHIDNKTGMTPQEQLKNIYRAIPSLYKKRDEVYQQVNAELRQNEIYCLTMNELTPSEKKFVDRYFKTYIQPMLSPQIIDLHHPFPHLENKALHIVLRLQESGHTTFGLIPLPKSIPRVIVLTGDQRRFILLEHILLSYVESVFSMYQVIDKTIIAVTRNADINPDDELFDVEEDYRHHMRKILKKRSRLASVRLEVQNEISVPLREYLCASLKLKKEQVFRTKAPIDLSYVFGLGDKFPPGALTPLSYPSFRPQYPAAVNKNVGIMSQLRDHDILLSYPFEQMDPFLQLVREAANDPDVISIKITIYRLSNKSKLVEYLSEAAENGKDVTALMELRARFDEENNINWTEALDEAGCKVIYGFENYKVHSKICLITRKAQDKIEYFTQIGTGNYNEKTSKQYTDLSLMTSRESIGVDAATYFKNMAIGNLNGEYSHLLVAPSSLQAGILQLIDEEIDRAEKTGYGRILMKMNSLSDRKLIDKLAEASQKGVKIDLIIRGICCLLPGIPGKTENIDVTSIVGRFLEHSRIYCFGEEADVKIYISSADLMSRNTERRVEIACPILEDSIKKRILHMLDILLADNVKARRLLMNGTYVLKDNNEGEPLNSQRYFLEEALQAAAEVLDKKDPPITSKKKRSLWQRLFGTPES